VNAQPRLDLDFVRSQFPAFAEPSLQGQAFFENAGGSYACAQVIGPVTSTYWWQGQIEAATEWLCLLKTTAVRSDELTAHLRDQHTYETPEIVVTPIVGGNPDYLSWIARETARV